MERIRLPLLMSSCAKFQHDLWFCDVSLRGVGVRAVEKRSDEDAGEAAKFTCGSLQPETVEAKAVFCNISERCYLLFQMICVMRYKGGLCTEVSFMALDTQKILNKVVDILDNFVLEFDPSLFEGKDIQEYVFPEFIESKIIDTNDSFNEKSLLLNVEKTRKITKILWGIIISVVFGGMIWACIGIPDIYYMFLEIVNEFRTGVFQMNNPVYGLLCVVGITIAVCVFGIKMCFFNNVWINLKKDSIECYRGFRFNPDKAKKYSVDDVKVFHEYVRGNNNISCIKILINSELPSASWFQTWRHNRRNGFRFSKDYVLAGEYVRDFLKWYICARKKERSREDGLMVAKQEYLI